ncbi:ABC transporter permease [Streptococcus pluranimalium]|uniref:ABC transporter permease n=1 Tax=Streptococcus pluranimalium TaxID=82348 RepID=UPI0039FBB41C
MLDIVLSSISQGLLWSIMAIGVFITFRILDIADLSAEGSFPLGAVVASVAILSGWHPILATLAGLVSGMLVGLVAGFLHTKMHIPPLLTGIITLTALYSTNLLVMGRSNVSLSMQDTLVILFQDMGLDKTMAVMVIGVIFIALVILSLMLFLNTQLGLALRATGDNSHMGQANGVNVNHMKVLGYMIGNGLIALSGALLAQNNGYADLNMGVGTIIIGLASVILAEVMIKHLPLGKRLFSIVMGSVIYRLIIVVILTANVNAQMIKLVSAVLLAIILYIPEIRSKLGVKTSKSLLEEN